jgi:HlyD family secretion protein
MKQSQKTWMLICVAFAVLLSGFFYFQTPEPVAITSYTVTSGIVKETIANTRVGTVKACRRAYLAPGTGGEVVALNVREGDAVKQGKILLEVWNEGLNARVDLMAAEINSKRAAAEQACKLSAGSGRVAKRLKNLQKHENIVSEEVVDLAVTKASAERAACRAAKAIIKVSLARLEVAQADLKRTQVRAPFDGIVAEVNAELGEYVTPSPPGIPTLPAIDLLDLSCVYISAPIDEVDAPAIKLGMQSCVSLDAFDDKRCSGKVTRIAPYVLEKEKQARTVEVEVQLTVDKETVDMMPGYSADIDILVDSRNGVLRIPTEALLEGNRVLVIQQDNLLRERQIQSGLRNWNFTEVISGLKAGDKIVLSVNRDGVKAGAYVVDEK